MQASHFLVKIHTNSLCRRWAPKGWRPRINGVPSPAPPTEPPVPVPDRHGTELTLESWLCQSREPSCWAVHGRNRPLQPLSLSLHPRCPRLVQVLLCLQRARWAWQWERGAHLFDVHSILTAPLPGRNGLRHRWQPSWLQSKQQDKEGGQVLRNLRDRDVASLWYKRGWYRQQDSDRAGGVEGWTGEERESGFPRDAS